MKQEHLLTLAWQIVDRLENAGHQAYLVGGYVRDRLLGRPIKDIDIATSARPDIVMSLFKRAEPTGLQHGTITVILEGLPFEVTTFRSESGYSDYRRPDDVRFINELREDLSRRDFTMNAMALNRSLELIDPFGGESDLRTGVLRCVGDPVKRFAEDALRMLRCVRFAAEYELKIEHETWQALLKHAPLIRNIAIERIRVELERIVDGHSPEAGLHLLEESGLHRLFTVELDLNFQPNANWNETKDPVVRWSMLWLSANIGAAKASRLMRKLTFPSRKMQAVRELMSFHQDLATADDGRPAEHQWKLLAIRYGKIAAERWLVMMNACHTLHLPVHEPFLRHGSGWLEEMPIADASMLAITGNDLLAVGFRSGPIMGAVLRVLVESAAVGAVRNEKQALLAEAQKLRLKMSEADE